MRSIENSDLWPPAFWVCFLMAPCYADVTFDNTLGSPVTPDTLSGNFEIPAARGESDPTGTNLFHSFNKFDINTGEIATFTGPGSIENILSRVTGNDISNIDGILRSNISGADLFLMNPAGIVFGPNATLDVSGSFHATTADYLRLGNGSINVKFNAVPGPEDALLTSAPVTAFGFLDGDQRNIQVNESTLQVSPEKALSLVGGDITITGGRIVAPSGQINIVSIKSAGEAAIEPSTSTVSVDVDQFERLGTVSLRAGPDTLGFFGPQPNPTTIDVSSKTGVGGSVFISGGDATIDRSKVSAGSAAGKGGNINFEVKRLFLINGADISSSATNTGSGGAVNISAATSTTLSGEGLLDPLFGIPTATRISSSTSGTARDAGKITIKTRELTVSDGAVLQATTTGDGRAGDIDLNVNILAATSGAKILSRTGGKGKGGTVTVRGIDGSEPAEVVSLNNGQISASTSGEGEGGFLDINTANLLIDNGEVSAKTSGTGTGGNVEINATEILLTNGGTISAESISTDTDAAASGNINITSSDSLRVFNNSSISVETQQATAGNINLKVGSLIHLKDQGKITTSASGGDGDGGNINIDPDFVVLEGGSEIIARAKEGSGGNINIVTGFLFQSPDSVIDASSETGIDGNINIDSPDTDIIPGTVQLPSNLLNAAALLSEPCFAKKLSNSSSLVVADQTGIPPGPDDMLSAQTEYRFDQAPPATLKSNASSEQPQVSALNSPPFANYIVSSKSPDTPCNNL